MDNLLKAILGFSLLLFSTYKGNDPKFDNFSYSYNANDLVISINLKDAFISDFKPIIKSTKPLFLNYSVKLTDESGKIIFSKTYTYSILFDAILQSFTLATSSQSVSKQRYRDAVDVLSSFKTNIVISEPQLLYAEISAYPQKMRINGKMVDLKLLWKNKIPHFKTRLIPRIYEY